MHFGINECVWRARGEAARSAFPFTLRVPANRAGICSVVLDWWARYLWLWSVAAGLCMLPDVDVLRNLHILSMYTQLNVESKKSHFVVNNSVLTSSIVNLVWYTPCVRKKLRY